MPTFPGLDKVLETAEKMYAFVQTLLDEKRLNYGFCPKGLLPFHKYKDHVSTAFEEHLFEAAMSASSNGKANLHFTISEKSFSSVSNNLECLR